VFTAAWADRPVSEITKLDVLEIINTKKRSAPQMARALLVLIKRFFGWCVDQEIYGLSASPCEGLSGKKLIGELQSRDRRLNERKHGSQGCASIWVSRVAHQAILAASLAEKLQRA
jgi:hypothetical protein